MVELLNRISLWCNLLLVRRSVWSLVELQFVFESFGMCGLWYLSRMFLTSLSVRLSLLYSLVVNSGSGNVISLFVFQASLVSSACDPWK